MNTSRGRVGVGVTLAVTAVLTGCGGSGGQDDGSAEGAEPSSTSTPSRASGAGTPTGTKQAASPSTSPSDTSGPADGSDVGACFDGRCEIALSKPTAIKVDSRFGVSGLRVTRITPDSVVLQSSGTGGTFLSTSLGEGGTGIQNKLGFRVKSLAGGTAVLEFFTG